MDESARLEIVSSLKYVDVAVVAVDLDRSVSRTLEILHKQYPEISILANGGDVGSEAECREAETCNRLGIRMVFGVGGREKKWSSSEILARVRGGG